MIRAFKEKKLFMTPPRSDTSKYDDVMMMSLL